MKTFMKREHAEFLKRQYMGMGLGRDIMLGLNNREALSHRAFSRQTEQQGTAAFRNSFLCESGRRNSKNY